MAKGSAPEARIGELKREIAGLTLLREVEAFRRDAAAAADAAQTFLQASPQEQKALRGEYEELFYRVTYKARKFLNFAKGPKAAKRKGA
jgi:hypothetical protein